MNKWYKLYFFVAAGILIFLGGATVFLPQNAFSENENRMLSQFPKFAWGQFLQGEYQQKLEDAIDDQTVGRDWFTAAATRSQRIMGYRDIEGVYLGEDQYYLTKTTETDVDMFRYMENLRYVEYLSERHPGQVSLLIAPSAGTVLADKLPPYAPFYQADSMYQAMKTVCNTTHVLDIRNALAKAGKKEQVYFRTDHHWTLPGAYVGYEAFCRQTGNTVRSYDSFAPKAVTKSFYGTLYSRVLDQTMPPDQMYAPTALRRPDSVLCDGKKAEGIYDTRKLRGKDKYGYFFGGNYGIVQMKTGADSSKKLVVFKDSYANSMVPFLLQDYEEIVMIDLRYYRLSVNDLLEQYAGADILVLYEMSNFMQDANLFKLSF